MICGLTCMHGVFGHLDMCRTRGSIIEYKGTCHLSNECLRIGCGQEVLFIGLIDNLKDPE